MASSHEMKHPYRDRREADERSPGRVAAWIGALVFAAFLAAPWAAGWRPGAGDGGDEGGGDSGGKGRSSVAAPDAATLRERLRALEDRVEAMEFFAGWRRADQAWRLRWLGAGNARVVAGEDGWLHYRPDLEAVVGKGPFYEEPASVAREPLQGEWRRPVPVIAEFAARLRERGVDLVLVPPPTKPMVCRTGLGLPPGRAAHPDWDRLLHRLRDEGVEVVDPAPALMELPDDEARYLRRDTHWTPRAMERAARLVADRLKERLDGPGDLETSIRPVPRSHAGDLVGMLDLPEGATPFPPETVRLRRVVETKSGEPLGSDPASPVVLLGDSFANVYEDPSLGFGAGDETAIGAGFPSHLAAALGRRLHVIARNGGGATAVRRAFARLPDDEVRAKRVVVWLLSARDLLLAERPARRAGIRWAPVTFRPPKAEEAGPVPGDPGDTAVLAVTATLARRSRIPDPTETPYPTAIFSALFEEAVIESGGIAGDEAERPAPDEFYVFLWAFRDRERSPAAALEPGRRYRLELVPLSAHEPAGRATALDDLFRTDLEPWFAVGVERVE